MLGHIFIMVASLSGLYFRNHCYICRHWLKVSVSLLVVMGISWIIGVITFHEALLFVSYIFTVVVAFQVRVLRTKILEFIFIALVQWLPLKYYYHNLSRHCSLRAGCHNVHHVRDSFKTGNHQQQLSFSFLVQYIHALP